jgi:ABC-2 type transport system ATP-binding protein
MITARGLGAAYGTTVALSDVSFELREGEVLAILGPNGSGKTTLFRLLLGFMTPTTGSLEVLGGHAGRAESLARIGATIETPSLYTHLSAFENLEITAALKETKETKAELGALLEEVGLGDAREPVKTFSLGMKQRLAIAAALIGKSQLLILDEPTNGLDPEGIRWFREWLVRAVKERGMSVILSSHILTEVAAVADRLLIMKKGRERFSGTVAEFEGGAETRLRTRELARSAATLRDAGFDVREVGHGLLVATDDVAAIAPFVVDHGILHLALVERDLEARYLALVDVT